jgi:hypothetical protein
MVTCDRCQAALLDRHYGLLDAADGAAVDAHLASCPICQAEQLRVERFGRLLSAAARSEFPDVRFAAPADTQLVSRDAEHSGAVRRRAPRLVNRLTWAIAAGLLLAISIPTGMHLTTVSRQETALAAAVRKSDDLERQRREVTAKHAAEVTAAQTDWQKAQTNLQATQSTLLARLGDAQRELAAKQLSFAISGPATVQAGAPAEFRIQTRDPAGQPAPAIVTYQVKDLSEKVVAEPTSLMTSGDVVVKLPPTLPLTPNRNLVLEVAAERTGGTKAVLREQIKLAAPLFITHLATDKPLYQPGEVVRFRSLTLDRASLKPAEEPLNIQFEVLDALGTKTAIVAGNGLVNQPDGKPVLGPDGKPVRGIGAGEWTIPPTAKGGEYTLLVKEANNRFPEEKRKFLVNQYQADRLNKVLEWSRKSFGPGDEVVANCKVTNASGPVAHQPVTFQAAVDGKAVANGPCGPTSSDGTVAVRFKLPPQIEKGEGSLTVTFTDGGNVDPLTKPIPIALKKLAVDFYAEGGDLVAGAANRVYFQVRTTLGKPADLKGRVTNDTGRVVATTETLTDDGEPGINQGMGRFEFTPEIGQKYRLLIDQPAGTEGEHKLPDVHSEGVVLTALNEVSGDPDPIRVRVTCPSAGRTLLVGAYARGRLLDHQRIAVPANQSADVVLKPQAGIGGVTRVTVFEELPGDGPHKQLVPRAERLVYRKPADGLKLTAEPDKARYVPGDHVSLSLKVDEPAIAMVGVVNKSVVTMADEKTFRTMPTHFLLTSEVRRPEDLEHADVLLGSHPKAAAALDLLLGTQGWRRFAEQNMPTPPNQKDDSDRILLAQANSPRIEVTSLSLATKKVEDQFGSAVARAQSELSTAAEGLNRLRSDQAYAQEQNQLGAEIEEVRGAVQSAQAGLSASREARERVLRWALPAACVLFLIIAAAALVLGLRRGLPYRITAAGSLGLAAAAAVVLALNAGGRVDVETRAAKADHALLAERQEGMDFGMQPEALGDKSGAAGKANWRWFGEAKDAPRNQSAPVDHLAQGLGGGVNGVAAPLASPAPLAPPAPGQPAGDAFYKMANVPLYAAAKPVDEEDLRRKAGEDKKADRRKDERGRLVEKQLGDLGWREDGKPAAPAAGAGLPALLGGIKAQDDFDDGVIAGGRAMGKRRLANAANRRPVPPPAPFVVREYAHHHKPSSAGDRTDFAETVFWHPVLVLPKDGAKVSFDLSDEVTRYQVLVAAHTLNGRLGALETQIEARKPFSCEPKLPVEITAGDRIDVPVTLANDTDASRDVTIAAMPKGLTLNGGGLEQRLTLAPQQSARRVFSFQPSIPEGTAELRLVGRSAPFGDDAVVRSVPVVPEGFPVVGAVSAVIDGTTRHEVVLPQTWVPGTLKCQVCAYPSTLAELQKGLEGLLREPGGCFEQTSTTNYPNALVLQYLKESDQANPAAMKQAKALLERGYAKLVAFEVPEKNTRQGFEWFGQFPAHEALTAYGLMQFRDMARVTDVDPQLLRRTRDYLLGRRDGKGGFTRNPLALDTFGRAPAEVTNAYIIWALTEGGSDDDVSIELKILAEQAKTSEDPYFLTLVANSLINRDRNDEANAILRKLAARLTKDGYLDGAKTSITGSSGRMLEIETTALAVLGWLKSNQSAEFAPVVRSAVGWIGKQRGGYGGFGSTQSTILALKALIAYTKANKKTPEAGELAIGVGDRVIGKLSFAAGVQDALTVALPAPEVQLKPGKNDVRVTMTGKNSFPYTLTWSYQTLQPPSAEGCAVRLTTTLDRPALAEGESAHLNVKLENVSKKGQGMAVVIIGLPAGLKLPDDFAQLKDLARSQENGTKPGRIGAFEVRGRELVLYWRDLAPDAVADLSLDVRALVPGAYRGPASRAYLYYDPDVKHWTAPLGATIAAKE